ncbi:MAG: class I SAM-dependent methyltransferase [Syntrophomonadaceae bacterium]|jgi:ubiquinone/menaquinone biosynthesis C-methylase UbiE
MAINAIEFDKIAREVFAPIYPVLAEQIISRFSIAGICLDIGCGGGYLGLAVARITDLNMILFDESDDMLKLADGYIRESGLETRAKTLKGDVHNIPLDDKTVNLAVSRGSMFFWNDRVKAFQEIYRVLADNGAAMIGGGFGNADLLKEIETKMLEIDPEWNEKRRQRIGKNKVEDYRKELEQAGISSYEIVQDETGLWIIIRRTA